MSDFVLPVSPMNFNSIVMPAESADKWLTALRSGEYAQGKGTLCNKNNEYCCLGVLQHVLTGDVERYVDNDNNLVSQGLPTIGWMEANNIHLKLDAKGSVSYLNRTDTCNPYVGLVNGKIVTASNANDLYELTFNEIADLLEHCIEKV